MLNLDYVLIKNEFSYYLLLRGSTTLKTLSLTFENRILKKPDDLVLKLDPETVHIFNIKPTFDY